MALVAKTNADGIGYIGAGSTLDGTVFENGTKYIADTIPGFVNGKIGAEKYSRPALSASTDFDTVTTIGVHPMPTSPTNVTTQHAPTNQAGALVVANVGTSIIQTYQTLQASGVVAWSRIKTAAWSEWHREGLHLKKALSTSSNLDTLTTAGVWWINSGSTATTLGIPGQSSGIFEVFPYESLVIQRYTTADRAVYLRTQVSGGWTAWGATGTPYMGTRNTIDDIVRPGRYDIVSNTTAQGLGLPTSGVIEHIPFGSSSALQVFYASKPTILIRLKLTAGWSAWKDLLGGGTASGSGTGSGFKRIPLAQSLGQSVADAWATASWRVPVQYNAPIGRFRVHIQNINPRFGTTRGGADFTGVAIADHTGNGTGANFKTVSGAFTLPSDGTEWVSPWISEDIGGNKSKLLSFGYTAAAAPFALGGFGYRTATPGDYTVATPGTLESAGHVPFFVWLEAETPATTPVIAVYGDSISVGSGATRPVFDSTLSVHARKVGALPVHYAASGDFMGDWEANPEHFKWNVWKDLDRPDSVLMSMGNNDVFDSAAPSTAELQRRFGVVSDIMADKVSATQYATTITPRDAVTDGRETTRREYNTWLKTRPGRVRDAFDYVAVVSTDDETLIPSLTTDGIHFNSAGYEAIAGAIVRPVTTEPLATVVKDTGWRKVTPPAGVTGNVFMRRKGDEVHMMFNQVVTTTAGNVTVYALPVGFQPQSISGANWRNGVVMDDNDTTRCMVSYFSGNMRFLNMLTSKQYGGYINFICADTWPATLPGTAV